MYMEEKQNFQTFQDFSQSIFKPKTREEISLIVKECYKKNSDGFVEDNNKNDNNMLRSTMKKISYFSTFDFAL